MLTGGQRALYGHLSSAGVAQLRRAVLRELHQLRALHATCCASRSMFECVAVGGRIVFERTGEVDQSHQVTQYTRSFLQIEPEHSNLEQ